MKITIELDPSLLREATQVAKTSSEREVIEEALRTFIRVRRQERATYYRRHLVSDDN